MADFCVCFPKMTNLAEVTGQSTATIKFTPDRGGEQKIDVNKNGNNWNIDSTNTTQDATDALTAFINDSNELNKANMEAFLGSFKLNVKATHAEYTAKVNKAYPQEISDNLLLHLSSFNAKVNAVNPATELDNFTMYAPAVTTTSSATSSAVVKPSNMSEYIINLQKQLYDLTNEIDMGQAIPDITIWLNDPSSSYREAAKQCVAKYKTDYENSQKFKDTIAHKNVNSQVNVAIDNLDTAITTLQKAYTVANVSALTASNDDNAKRIVDELEYSTS